MEIPNPPNPQLLHFLFLLIALTHFTTNSPSAAAAADFNRTAEGAPPSCHGGSIAECSQLDLEMGLESETTTRLLLQGSRYITPPALNPDRPVCNGGARGRPYSNGGGCLPEQSNPYNRGCPKIYRCRSGD